MFAVLRCSIHICGRNECLDETMNCVGVCLAPVIFGCMDWPSFWGRARPVCLFNSFLAHPLFPPFLFFCLVGCLRRVSCSQGWPQLHYGIKDDHPPQPPECWAYSYTATCCIYIVRASCMLGRPSTHDE